MDSRHAIARASKSGVIVTVHVQPSASRTECVGIHGDALKIRIAALPTDGAANEELLRFIADRCAIPRTNVLIQAGAGSRHKRLYLKGVTAELVRARLLSGGEKGVVKG